MNVKPLHAIFPKLDLIASPESFFGTVKYQFRDYLKSGFFGEENKDSFFIYRITTGKRTHTGLICMVSTADYDEGRILKHEKTLSAKEQKTIHLLLQREAMVKPTLLTFNPTPQLNQLINTHIDANDPFFEVNFEESGHLHSLYKISQSETIESIMDVFLDKIDQMFIADGHHRFSACSLLNKSGSTPFDFSYVLSVLFPFNELEILDFNRTIQILHEISPVTIMAKLSKLFDFEILDSGRKPDEKHELVLYLNKEWFGLKWKKKVLNKYKNQDAILDVDLFNELVLNDSFGIKDVSSDIRIGYVTGKNGVNSLTRNVDKNEYRIGFLLYPITIEEMIHISNAGKTLPPKSTWFEPRIINGLISKSL